MTERAGQPPERRTSESEPYAIDWIDLTQVPGLAGAPAAGGALGMSHAPGVVDPVKSRDRDVGADVARLRDVHQVDALVLLLGDEELPLLHLSELPAALDAAGIELVRFPVPDFGVPQDAGAFRSVVDDVLGRVGRGQRVLVACRAGFGRTGTATACLLRSAGLGPSEAIATVRSTRPGTIEREIQARFVEGWGD